MLQFALLYCVHVASLPCSECVKPVGPTRFSRLQRLVPSSRMAYQMVDLEKLRRVVTEMTAW